MRFVGREGVGGGTHRAHRCEGQITKCRWFSIVFYVRENLDGGWSFYISSNERMSDKGSNRGTGKPAAHRNVLDPCTRHDSDWETTADIARAINTLTQYRRAGAARYTLRCDPATVWVRQSCNRGRKVYHVCR